MSQSRKMRIFGVMILCLLGVTTVWAQSSDSLVGAGSSFAAPLYEKWIDSFTSQKPGMPVKFEAIGSGAGLKQLESKQADFAASDFVPTAEYQRLVNVKVLPIVVGGVVPAYNLPGVQAEVRFTPLVLAEIYLGAITKWDDPQLKAVNHGVKLPSAQIVPVHRSDVSGSNHVWTEFLSLDPAWRAKFGVSNSIAQWPAGKGAELNEGVAHAVANTPYSLGYVELIYALKQHLKFGSVQDADGKFVRADIDSLTAAANTLSGDSLSIVNARAPGAYPIASLTWIVIPVQTPEAKRQSLTEFLSFVFSQGQREAAALGYIALPEQFAESVRASLSKLWAQGDALVQKIQTELAGPFPPEEGKPNPAVPHGEMLQGAVNNSKIYPGTENNFQVYVPAQYDPAKPACFLIRLDGFSSYEATVLDNLIAKHEIPVMIGIGIVPGTIWKPLGSDGTNQRQAERFDRSYEFDSVNDNFPAYVLTELLPVVESLKTRDGRAIHLSKSGNDHAVTGGSTGGIGSFTLAWRRPDQFTRVYSVIGTFVSMRGGHEYPALVRKTDPKPIRIFLEDGSTDAWNPLFGSWYEQNLEMESALSFAGYDVAHAWGVHGHNGRPGQVIFPDVMRWLWRDYPTPVNVGVSSNSTLQEITLPDQPWQQIPGTFQAATGLTANKDGDVYISDVQSIFRVGAENGGSVLLAHAPELAGEAFGPDGTLYALAPEEKKVLAIDQHGSARTIAEGISGRAIVVNHEGAIFISEPGAHPDLPSRIWQIDRDGRKKMVDEGLSKASGIGFSPDDSLFFAAESATKWIYSYIVQPDGKFSDKQRFYWLHMTDIPNDSGAEELAVDAHGNLYVATRMGIQVCDQNGRVRAILPLPTPSGPVRSLCFGGKNFDVLYATDGEHVFSRVLKVPGFAQWASPITYKSQGAG